MAERTEKLILIPRYSTFAGAGDYWMKPIPARRYATAIVAAWRVSVRRTPPCAPPRLADDLPHYGRSRDGEAAVVA